MPKEVDKVYTALRREGYSKERSWAIAWSQYRKKDKPVQVRAVKKKGVIIRKSYRRRKPKR